MEIRRVELPDMLQARERRALRQRELLARYPETLICFTMNIAGPVKNSDPIRNAWEEGLRQLRTQLRMAGLVADHGERSVAFTGNEAFLSVPAPALQVKQLMVELEEEHPLGRLFDIDVLRADGSKVERQEVNRPPRRCLICGEPAAVCASRRLHSVETLQKATGETIDRFFAGKFADHIAELATKALLYEVAVTPKPGLVDRYGSGAHRDMDFYTFLSSTAALTPHFREMVRTGIQSAEEKAGITFQKLQFRGKMAESAMRSATAGVNTHKGAIFSVGVLCGALGRLYGQRREISPDNAFAESAALVRESFEEFTRGDRPSGGTVGDRLFREYGITGVRGEAAEGFPSVRRIGLPILKNTLREGRSPDEAGYTALLHLIATVTDTNLIARSDYEVQKQIQQGLRDWLKTHDTVPPALAQTIDQIFTRRNLSPGGCADLLAVSWMMYFLEQEPAFSGDGAPSGEQDAIIPPIF